MAKYQKKKTLRVKRNAFKKKGTVSKSKKTARRVKKMVSKKGGMPLRYYGGPVNSTLTQKAGMTTSCKMPPNTTWNCLKPN